MGVVQSGDLYIKIYQHLTSGFVYSVNPGCQRAANIWSKPNHPRIFILKKRKYLF